MDTAAVRRTLEQMLADLDRDLGTLSAERPAAGELADYERDPADYGTDLSDTEREVAVMAVGSRQREEVRAALRRLDEGSYGRCIDCGRELPSERLAVRPEAARCIDDQARVERQARGTGLPG